MKEVHYRMSDELYLASVNGETKKCFKDLSRFQQGDPPSSLEAELKWQGVGTGKWAFPRG